MCLNKVRIILLKKLELSNKFLQNALDNILISQLTNIRIIFNLTKLTKPIHFWIKCIKIRFPLKFEDSLS